MSGGRYRIRTRDPLGVNVGTCAETAVSREGGDRTNLQPTANGRGSADHSLSTGPRHYRDYQLSKSPHYVGVLDQLSDEEVRVMAEEVVTYFGLHAIRDVPLPPKGLPGLTCGKGPDDAAADILMLGIKYARAMLLNQGRAMHLLWEKAEEMFRSHLARERAKAEAETADLLTKAFMERRTAQAEAPSFVYFIASQSGPIKIGIATDVQARLKGLQTAHHEKLELLATCSGGQSQERAYHKQFAAHRLHGEWFERCPEILAEIDTLISVAESALAGKLFGAVHGRFA